MKLTNVLQMQLEIIGREGMIQSLTERIMKQYLVKRYLILRQGQVQRIPSLGSLSPLTTQERIFMCPSDFKEYLSIDFRIPKCNSSGPTIDVPLIKRHLSQFCLKYETF